MFSYLVEAIESEPSKTAYLLHSTCPIYISKEINGNRNRSNENVWLTSTDGDLYFFLYRLKRQRTEWDSGVSNTGLQDIIILHNSFARVQRQLDGDQFLNIT